MSQWELKRQSLAINFDTDEKEWKAYVVFLNSTFKR